MNSDNNPTPLTEPENLFGRHHAAPLAERRGAFSIFMLCLGGLSFVSGVVFVLMGAWPVFGFFGLDVLLVYLAFRANFRAARAYEEVTVTAVRTHGAQGQPSRRRARMDAQSALGAARPHRARGIRHRAAVPGLARPAAADCRRASGRTRRQASRARCRPRWARPSAGRPGRCSRHRTCQSAQKSGGFAGRGGLDREQMMEAPMLSPDRISEPDAAHRSRRRLRRGAPRHRPYPRPLARAARNRGHRRSGRRHADRAAPSVPPLGRH